MFTGTITSVGAHGFWFLADDESRDSVFVHISQVENHKWLHLGDRVSFELGTNPKSGRPWATNVKIVWAAPISKPELGEQS
jgi:cold shock CspA family protein